MPTRPIRFGLLSGNSKPKSLVNQEKKLTEGRRHKKRKNDSYAVSTSSTRTETFLCFNKGAFISIYYAWNLWPLLGPSQSSFIYFSQVEKRFVFTVLTQTSGGSNTKKRKPPLPEQEFRNTSNNSNAIKCNLFIRCLIKLCAETSFVMKLKLSILKMC